MRYVGLALVAAFGTAATARAQIPPPPTVAERAAFFQELAREKSTAAIEQRVRAALGDQHDAAPRYELEALLERYFELDATAAVRFAGELPNPPLNVVRTMYGRLASSDPNGALEALSVVDNAPLAQFAATAIVDALGKSLASIDLVAAAIHTGNVEQFRSEALMSVASTAPRDALAAALRLRDPDRRNATAASIVARWAQDAPRDAMQEVERVQDPALRSALRGSVLRGWTDAESLVTYLNGLDDTARRAAMQQGVLYRIIEADAERAAAFAQSLPLGPERTAALQQVASSFAQKDPKAAFQWAQRLDPAQPQVVQSVISITAASDPLRAFDLVATLPEPARMQAYGTVIGSGHPRDQSQFEQLAGRVAALPDGQNKQALLVSLLGSWGQGAGNAKPALEWALAHSAALPPQAFMALGYSLAQSDPDSATAYLDRVPSTARAGWIGVIASGYMRSDPQRALAFVERFRGDPAYDDAVAMLAPQLAATDAPAAARLLGSMSKPPANAIGMEIQVAREWAQRDPEAAATWALDLPRDRLGIAMSMIGEVWGQSNPGAVRSWALALPPSDKRDFALAAALRAAGPGAPDATLLAAFSDARQRQAAVMTTIMMTAATDAPLARRLVDEHISDPQLRARAAEMLDAMAHGGMPVPTGGIRSPATGLPVPAGVLVGPNGVISVPADAILAPGSLGGAPFVSPPPARPATTPAPTGR